MSQCEICLKQATKTCGLESQPMLDFCDDCYKQHVREAHPTQQERGKG